MVNTIAFTNTMQAYMAIIALILACTLNYYLLYKNKYLLWSLFGAIVFVLIGMGLVAIQDTAMMAISGWTIVGIGGILTLERTGQIIQNIDNQ